MNRRYALLLATGSTLVFGLACGLAPELPGTPSVPVATPVAAPGAGDDITVAENPRISRVRQAPPTGPANDVMPGRYVMKLRRPEGASLTADGRLSTGNPRIDAALGKAGVKRARAVHRRGKRASGLYSVDSDTGEAGLQGLQSDPDVEWVEPVRRYDMATYSDPYYRYQWNMSELQLESVHSRTQGQGVIVGVVDSGVTAGADSPVNLLKGWDFQDDDADASDSAAATQSPSGSHGTHVAGTIAQASNNGVGVTGIAPMASILPVRVGDYNGIASDNIAEGIEWAVDNGAQVINISIGGATSSRVVEEACKYAYEKGVVVVAASGNDGYNGKVSYPAAYSTVIAVGAHDGAFKETSYSNNGRELALLAPGGDTNADLNKDGKPDGILQGTITSKGWGYAMLQGTSMASPHVAGAAALLIASGVRGPDAVRSALIGGASTQGSFRVLNILGSLDYAASGNAPIAPAPGGTDPVADGARGGKRGDGSGVRPDGGGPGAVAPTTPGGGPSRSGDGPAKGGKAGKGEKGEKGEKAGRKRPGRE